ncbi:hypothetical protein H4W80_000925 [Nonomuraea angiospora]|uniref:Uncharacterized protein n=1 Tax=Nonomuraea angiospora TaxID=46172 RepID=A0ABR9LPT3_9ACTN|nr:hypothetical protein [Nonomuraea angiospora]
MGDLVELWKRDISDGGVIDDLLDETHPGFTGAKLSRPRAVCPAARLRDTRRRTAPRWPASAWFGPWGRGCRADGG